MAMAGSSIYPLVRLQTRSKELRAERELCQVVAKQGSKAEAGAKISTVIMGSRIDGTGLADAMEDEAASALYFNESLQADIGNFCLNPMSMLLTSRQVSRALTSSSLLWLLGAAMLCRPSSNRPEHRWRSM